MRMSSAEAIMWAVEKDPALRSDFCNLTFLDRRPAANRLRATLERTLEAIPRLRQRVVAAPLRIAPPEFADDPTLDVDAHMRVVGLPSPGDERALLDLCAGLTEHPLDRARPLWEFTLIEGLPGDRVALLQRVHHTITDGVGALRLSLALVDLERDPPPTARTETPARDADAAIGRDTPLDVTRQALLDAAARNLRAARGVVDQAGHLLTHPGELPTRAEDAARMVGSLRRQLLVTDRARSDVMTGRSTRRHLALHAVPLLPLREAATKLGGSLNDAFVTGLAGGLGRYHARFGSATTELRLAMPISRRARGDDAPNRFVPARVVVPIQPVDDVAALFAAVHDRLSTIKEEASLGAAESIAGVVAALPTSLLVSMTRAQARTVDFAVSNMRGSPVPLYLAGARIIASYPFGPRTGTALNVTMLSYCDELHLGCDLDPAAVTDPAGLLRDIGAGFDALVEFV